MTHAALGFRAHSGWAALVVVAEPAASAVAKGSTARALPAVRASPSVIERRRIELVEPGMPKQPYHAAEGLDLQAAEELVRRCTEGARSLARQAIGAMIDEWREKGHDVVGCGILLGSGRRLGTLAATLASHALIHTAEGELFREALIHASEHCKLPVTGVRERELFERGAAQLRLPVGDLERRVAELGKAIGPPWRQDEKYAALVAWLALAAEGAAPERRQERRP